MEQNIYLDKKKLEDLEERLGRLGQSMDLDDLRSRLKVLTDKTMEPGFWDDSQAAQKVIRQQNSLKDRVDKYDGLEADLEEASLMIDLMEEEEDFAFYENFKDLVQASSDTLDDFEVQVLLDGEYDESDVIFSIHAGAGGTEAQDWAGMLLRMYKRYAEKKGYKVETLDLLEEDEAGIKSVTLAIRGPYAYGYLKAEKGVHRLVRISPFDSAKKRHTSFASVDVYPELDDEIEIDIKDEDLKIDTYRSSGAGGQHVNVTDSAVRITHIPTGIVVQCQNERSQMQNKETAMKMLKAKLLALAEEEQKEKIEDLQGNYSQIAWGSQIRSYVFHPYTMVKDLRTQEEVGDVQRVMDGDLDPFINAYLEANSNQ